MIDILRYICIMFYKELKFTVKYLLILIMFLYIVAVFTGCAMPEKDYSMFVDVSTKMERKNYDNYVKPELDKTEIIIQGRCMIIREYYTNGIRKSERICDY